MIIEYLIIFALLIWSGNFIYTAYFSKYTELVKQRNITISIVILFIMVYLGSIYAT
jgi:hypothetical protein